MNPEDFTDRPDVVDLIASLRRACAARAYSDIVDDRGNQYVDIVMAGGGLLGIAIVGYLYALEAVGIRFLRIAGTSAGSITALLLAALDERDEAKAFVKLVEILSAMDTWSFVDGGREAQSIVTAYLDHADRLEMAFDAMRVFPTVWSKRGLNPGEKFVAWLSAALAECGITTTAQLLERMKRRPAGLRTRAAEPVAVADFDVPLALVAAELATETKVDLPRMAPLFWPNSNGVNPAIYVRASMAIPFFFEPLVVGGIPQGRDAANLWDELAAFKGGPPQRCAFVDGGIISNFPIGIFHRPGVPRAPTFGISLESKDRTPNTLDGAWSFATAIFDSARHCLDYDFIARNPDYEKLVGYINTNGFNWLDFRMSDERKVELFAQGVRAAVDFLRKFDWEGYKRIREHAPAPGPA